MTEHSGKELQIILDSVQAWIFYKDKENRFIRVNKAYADAMGVSKESLEGKSVFDLYPGEQAGNYWRDDKEVMKFGKSKMGIVETVDTPKGRLWVRTDKMPYRDERGNIIGIIGFAVDITERKKIEEELEGERHFTDNLINALQDIFYVFDVQGNFITWNRAFETVSGYSHDEVSSMKPTDFFTMEGAVNIANAIKVAFKEGHNSVEEEFLAKGGRKIPMFFSGSTIKDPSGQLILCGIGKDISDLKKAEEKARQVAEQWDTTFNSISDLMFIADKDNNIVKVNRALAGFFKKLPEELAGKKCYNLLHGLENPWPSCPLEKTKNDLKPHIEEVYDSHIGVPLLVTTSPIFNDKNELTGVVHIARDISSIKENEKELKKKIEDLEKFQKITVDRELRMKELKDRISELETRLEAKT